MTKLNPFCAIPWVEGFSGFRSSYRNCCVVDPEIQSIPGQTFTDWWHDPRLHEFRKKLLANTWPEECYRCRVQEEQSGSSLRTVINQTKSVDTSLLPWPSRWNLKFGNVCNLACWSCSEAASSVIAEHKKRISILPTNFVDPEQHFATIWPDLKLSILKSYESHDTVTLTILGGEPLYNQTVINFLNELIDSGLSRRTKLEFHTNGTKSAAKIFSNHVWKYVCVFVSVDAIGHKAEWLRYGCSWDNIESNINFFKSAADYVEIHCTLSVLNINDLPNLKKFCESNGLLLKIGLVANPDFMSILNWSGDKTLLTDQEYLVDNNFGYYYDLLGSKNNGKSQEDLKQYITQFNSIRKPLKDFDARLARAIGLG